GDSPRGRAPVEPRAGSAVHPGTDPVPGAAYRQVTTAATREHGVLPPGRVAVVSPLVMRRRGGESRSGERERPALSGWVPPVRCRARVPMGVASCAPLPW